MHRPAFQNVLKLPEHCSASPSRAGFLTLPFSFNFTMAFATASPIEKSQSGRYRMVEIPVPLGPELEPESRIFIVSNRLPYRVSEGKLVRGDGGLVSALLPVHRSSDCYWVGDGGFADLADSSIDQQMRQHRIIDVGVDRSLSSLHYNGASNGAIWPLFHYFPAMCSFDPREWEAYQEVCVRFADVICEHATRCGSTIISSCCCRRY